ncbi:MAG: hypothetical protein COT24_02925 [Candidatus Kerfeldbacteria bacterium CG08_land_8_20_14_0_20_40_16]|uniref:GIY-YIG domain-containing protein n=1 Tax=Candidatus Kerfeldbacteria bacterium CG08_land_8_20_14_0_20_40_16 TaxID=2014244 RepID=A0A2H0YVP6_9BACT|nr:MAG: hypothetical protein COT24_02925 [Candidatus Kerfeldbacteria bacterium CG08_land_8_20_14_0_20_40_16]
MSYYVYITESQKDFCYYIGVTSDVKKRLYEHNAGLSKSTKPRRPFKLVRVEKYNDRKTAYQRERFLKSKKSSKIIEKIIKS